MIKTILATIGFFVVIHKSHEFYCDYRDLKKENEFFHKQEKERGMR